MKSKLHAISRVVQYPNRLSMHITFSLSANLCPMQIPWTKNGFKMIENENLTFTDWNGFFFNRKYWKDHIESGRQLNLVASHLSWKGGKTRLQMNTFDPIKFELVSMGFNGDKYESLSRDMCHICTIKSEYEKTWSNDSTCINCTGPEKIEQIKRDWILFESLYIRIVYYSMVFSGLSMLLYNRLRHIFGIFPKGRHVVSCYP